MLLVYGKRQHDLIYSRVLLVFGINDSESEYVDTLLNERGWLCTDGSALSEDFLHRLSFCEFIDQFIQVTDFSH